MYENRPPPPNRGGGTIPLSTMPLDVASTIGALMRARRYLLLKVTLILLFHLSLPPSHHFKMVAAYIGISTGTYLLFTESRYVSLYLDWDLKSA